MHVCIYVRVCTHGYVHVYTFRCFSLYVYTYKTLPQLFAKVLFKIRWYPNICVHIFAQSSAVAVLCICMVGGACGIPLPASTAPHRAPSVRLFLRKSVEPRTTENQVLVGPFPQIFFHQHWHPNIYYWFAKCQILTISRDISNFVPKFKI
jgi:hypothetical protein